MDTLTNTLPNPVKSRRAYHTNVKFLVQFNLLPKQILSLIPKSNISRWKNSDFSHIFGKEFSQTINDDIQNIQELMKHKKFTRACICLLRVKNSIITILKKTKGKIKDLEIKKIIVDTINRVKNTLTLKKAVHYFKITIHQYYVWVQQIKTKCLETITNSCPRIYPNQLAKNEIKKMQKYFQNIAYKGWPIFSICWQAIKNGDLYVSVGTWYKYARILGFSKSLPQSRRKNYPVGIRANRIIEKIHADVTIFRPMDNTRVYIYIIMDNYILAWKASLKLSAEIFVENLKEVYKKYILPFSQGKSIELIVDGGSENNNDKVDLFLDDIDGAIEKLIAQKDIIFSNSIIESVNKTLKYRHLFQHDILDYHSTVRHLEKAIPGYNTRPHYTHKGLTPQEVSKGIQLNTEQYKKYFQQAYHNRIHENQQVRCQNCKDIIKK